MLSRYLYITTRNRRFVRFFWLSSESKYWSPQHVDPSQSLPYCAARSEPTARSHPTSSRSRLLKKVRRRVERRDTAARQLIDPAMWMIESERSSRIKRKVDAAQHAADHIVNHRDGGARVGPQRCPR